MMRIAEYKSGELNYRDATEAELLEAEQVDAEYDNANAMPTELEKIEAQVIYTALVTNTLLEED